jgi:RNA polymerase sigma factor (sigma-70 family)
MLGTMPSRHDDATLVQAAADGDPEAFAVLFERWFDRSYDVAWRIVRNPDTAAEVAQDTFLEAWRHLGTLRDPAAFGGWVLRTARNRALNRIGKDHRSPLLDAHDAIDARGAQDPAPDVATVVTTSEQDQLVWAAAATLGDRDTSLLDLHLRHGLDAQEIGEALGVTTNNAHQLLFRLKAKLRVSIRSWVLWHQGRPRCDSLAELLTLRGVRAFDATTSKLIAEHADGCVRCEEHRGAVLAPEALFASVPILPAPLLLRQQVAHALAAGGVPMATPSTPAVPGATAAGSGERGPQPAQRRRPRRRVVSAVALTGALILLVVLATGQPTHELDRLATNGATPTVAPTTATIEAPQGTGGAVTAPSTSIAPSTSTPTTSAPVTTAAEPEAYPSTTTTDVDPRPSTTTTIATEPVGNPPAIVEFTAEAGPVGDPACESYERAFALAWTVRTADDVTVTLSGPGVPADPLPVAWKLIACVSPNEPPPITWTLTATGPGGASSASAAV